MAAAVNEVWVCKAQEPAGHLQSDKEVRCWGSRPLPASGCLCRELFAGPVSWGGDTGSQVLTHPWILVPVSGAMPHHSVTPSVLGLGICGESPSSF